MKGTDKAMAKRLHAIITRQPRCGPLAEDLVRHARIRQGRQDRLLLQERREVQVRYATFGEEAANLDDGAMWPTSWALKELTAADEKRITALVKKAVG